MSDLPSSEPGQQPPPEQQGPGWFQRITSILFILFCFELGLFLLIYPWTASWGLNYFAWLISGPYQNDWHGAWTNPWLRGAISGLGLANLWIAVAEVFRLFSKRQS